jgi:hypothetical protein
MMMMIMEKTRVAYTTECMKIKTGFLAGFVGNTNTENKLI